MQEARVKCRTLTHILAVYRLYLVGSDGLTTYACSRALGRRNREGDENYFYLTTKHDHRRRAP